MNIKYPLGERVNGNRIWFGGKVVKAGGSHAKG